MPALSTLVTDFQVIPHEDIDLRGNKRVMNQLSFALVSALNWFGKTDAEMTKHICASIRNMVDHNDSLHDSLSQAGLARPLLGVLSGMGETNADVARDVCETMLCVQRCFFTEELVKDSGYGEVMINILKMYGDKYEGASTVACEVLATLFRHTKIVFSLDDTVANAVVSAFERFGKSNVHAAQALCHVVGVLVCEHPDNTTRLVNQGILQLVFNALKRFGMEDEKFATFALFCLDWLNAEQEGSIPISDHVEALETIVATMLAHPELKLDYNRIGLRLCQKLIAGVHEQKDRLLRAGLCDAVVLAMERHGHEDMSLAISGCIVFNTILQSKLNYDDLISQNMLERAATVVVKAIQQFGAEGGALAMVSTTAICTLLHDRDDAHCARLISLGIAQALMFLVESFAEDEDIRVIRTVLVILCQVMGVDTYETPNLGTPSACRALINLLNLYNTRDADVINQLYVLILRIAHFDPLAAKRMGRFGGCRAVTIGLASFGVKNSRLAFTAMSIIATLIKENVEGAMQELANFTFCNAVVDVLKKFDGEDWDTATAACYLVGKIAIENRTAKGIFRYMGAHLAIRNAVYSECKHNVMKALQD